jgi:hypothetical protein
MYSLLQLCSRDSAGTPQPVWGLYVDPSNFSMLLVYGANNAAPVPGPHAGESGVGIYKSTVSIPVGKWNFFELMVAPRANFTGAIKLWMNGVVLHDQSAVITQYPNTSAAGLTYIQHTAYGSGLTPTPYSHYVDDVTISLGRMPYP